MKAISVSGSGIRQSMPPTFMGESALAQAAAVQNTWYNILNTTANAEVSYVCIMMATAGETLNCRITIDGQTYTQDKACLADTWYYVVLNPKITGMTSGMTIGATQTLANYYQPLRAKSIKIELQKTTANGANVLNGIAVYGKW